MNFMMNNFDTFFNFGLVFSGLMFVFTISFIIYIFYSMFSKKGRSRFVGRQLDISKTVLEDNKDVIMDLSEIAGDIGVGTKKNFMDRHEDDLTHMASQQANIHKDAIKTTVSAIREGIKGDDKFCKYCGAGLDADAIFCDKCGKKQ